AEGRFREDLFYRLNGIELRLPPLAQRPRDILPLARHFLPNGKRLGEDAQRALQRHTWPGNVRELRNVMQRAALLARDAVIAATDLALPATSETVGIAGDEPDRTTIEAALARNGGVLAQAAADLGLSRQALYRRLDRLGIPRS
ncbi:MAG: helix-turn-helix domain-containing protein, partial [Thermomonas sp.]|uniref:helix-turn-helix domain-containing protein n=1 Tax=Thermomonas sp. TaxID=1971895 RepID=UPI0039E5A33B